MEINGKTKIIGLFGYPVEHSLSPHMHNSAFRELDFDIIYVAFKVSPEDLTDAIKAVKFLNLLGINITVPHKERAIPLLDSIDEEASFIGAINTIVNSEGVLKGYNTDGRGFLSSLSEEGISIDGKRIMIIGTGGACRAISYYLSEKASELSLYDIDKSKAEKLIGDLEKIRDNVFLLDKIDDAERPDIIINATPLGMKSNDPSPVNPDLITSDMVVCDLVYKKTKLLYDAEKKGAKTLNGSGMLLWQGVLAFELWTGIIPPVDLMRKALLSRIK